MDTMSLDQLDRKKANRTNGRPDCYFCPNASFKPKTPLSEKMTMHSKAQSFCRRGPNERAQPPSSWTWRVAHQAQIGRTLTGTRLYEGFMADVGQETRRVEGRRRQRRGREVQSILAKALQEVAFEHLQKDGLLVSRLSTSTNPLSAV